jgi:tetratricopeptide (TPR) repeat protein
MNMKKLIFASLVLVLTAGASSLQAQLSTLAEGIKQLQNENYTAALNTFNTIAKNDPKNGTIYYYIGEVSYRTDDPVEAEKAYKKGLSINPQCAECKVGLGKLLLDQGKAAEAEENFLSATRIDKKNAAIFAMIGSSYLHSKKPNGQKAVEYLSTATGMDFKVASYWAELGEAYKLINNNGEAMTAFQTAVEKDPNNSAAYVSMAKIWKAAKQDSLAIAELEKAIKVAPDDAAAYKELIEIYIRNGQYSKVTPLLEKYVSLMGDDVDAKVRLVKFLTFQAKDYDRAITEGEKILKTNPEQYTLHRWLAWSYAEKGDYPNSLRHSEMLFEDIGKKEDRATFPSDYDYWAKSALQLGKIDSAAHIYRKYLELDSSRSQEIYGTLAKAYFDSKNYAQAINYYVRKGEEKELNVGDNYWLGLSYYYNDEDIKADSVFRKVLEVTPDHANSWLMRARIGVALDTAEVKTYAAKEPYENYIRITEPDTANLSKTRKNLIGAYKWLGIYWVQQEDYAQGKTYFEKGLALDPEDAELKEYIRILKER